MTQNNKREVGALYEQLAGQYLEQQGYKILQYNYRCPIGEIDIIAREEEYLVFCEVKYRKTAKQGMPQEAVTIKKQKTISKCAQYYLMKHPFGMTSVRFDVVAIDGSKNQGETVTLIRNAFDFIR